MATHDRIIFRGGRLYRPGAKSETEQKDRGEAAEWHSVTSSNIKKIRWLEGSGLCVWFLSGQVYHYPSAPRSVFAKMLEADSPGGFLNTQVKPKYKFAGPFPAPT